MKVLVDEIGPGITSVEYVGSQFEHGTSCVSVKDLLARYREPVIIDTPLITSDGVALGGHRKIATPTPPARRRETGPASVHPGGTPCLL